MSNCLSMWLVQTSNIGLNKLRNWTAGSQTCTFCYSENEFYRTVSTELEDTAFRKCNSWSRCCLKDKTGVQVVRELSKKMQVMHLKKVCDECVIIVVRYIMIYYGENTKEKSGHTFLWTSAGNWKCFGDNWTYKYCLWSERKDWRKKNLLGMQQRFRLWINFEWNNESKTSQKSMDAMSTQINFAVEKWWGPVSEIFYSNVVLVERRLRNP